MDKLLPLPFLQERGEDRLMQMLLYFTSSNEISSVIRY